MMQTCLVYPSGVPAEQCVSLQSSQGAQDGYFVSQCVSRGPPQLVIASVLRGMTECSIQALGEGQVMGPGIAGFTREDVGIVTELPSSVSGLAASAGGPSFSVFVGGGGAALCCSSSGIVRLPRGASKPLDSSGILDKFALGSWVSKLEGACFDAGAGGGGGDRLFRGAALHARQG